MTDKKKITIDEYFSSTALGSLSRAVGNTLYGINHQQVPPVLPMTKDMYGLTLMVRPQLNLQTDNLRNVRSLYSLLSTSETSIQRYIRCMLDPRLQHGHGSGEYSKPLTCPLVDPLQAFIPVASSTLLTLSGWPDVVSPLFVSEPGLYKENYLQVDGTTKIYNNYDLDLTFRNFRGNPLVQLFQTWQTYTSCVFEGTLVPYLDFIIENEIDYMTRIYKFTFASDKETINMMAATGVSVPISTPMGNFFDHNHEMPFNNQVKEFTVRMSSLGAIYNDPILVHEFNKTVQIFNPYMRDNLRETQMTKIPRDVIGLFNNRGYPRINHTNMKLEIWIQTDIYNKVIEAYHMSGANPYTTELIADNVNAGVNSDVKFI